MKKYLISGLGISESGVGRLMRNLTSQAREYEFSVIARRNNGSVKEMFNRRRYAGVLIELMLRYLDRVIFYIKVFSVSGSVIVFVHPQTVGFKLFLRLIRRNKVYFYVMDNSFFCIRSYNNDPDREVECLRCLDSPENTLSKCQPFPVNIKKSDNIDYLRQLGALSNKVFFLVQTQSQAKLIVARFGTNTRYEVVGLDTGELNWEENIMPDDQENNAEHYDLVFHGAPSIAKGLRYFVELAETLSELSAFIPSSKIVCESVLKRKIYAKNIVFSNCTWESGLKNIIKNCELVINPSLWSAPIEGALQKSIFFSKKVATVESEFGYEREILASDVFIRLPKSVADSAVLIRKLFLSPAGSSIINNDSNSKIVELRVNVFDFVEKNER